MLILWYLWNNKEAFAQTKYVQNVRILSSQVNINIEHSSEPLHSEAFFGKNVLPYRSS